MSDFSGIGKAIDSTLKALVIALFIFVPLGLWKMIEIAVWIFSNVHVHIAVIK